MMGGAWEGQAWWIFFALFPPTFLRFGQLRCRWRLWPLNEMGRARRMELGFALPGVGGIKSSAGELILGAIESLSRGNLRDRLGIALICMVLTPEQRAGLQELG